jgi:prepilin-type processing-associated H-X9-DG protein
LSLINRQEKRDEFIGKPLKIDEIPMPSQTLLCIDSGYALVGWWYATDEPPLRLGDTPIEDTSYIPGLSINQNRKLMTGQEQDALYGRHPNKKINVGFVDGHIEFKKADDLLVIKYEDGYKNKSPLWVPK